MLRRFYSRSTVGRFSSPSPFSAATRRFCSSAAAAAATATTTSSLSSNGMRNSNNDGDDMAAAAAAFANKFNNSNSNEPSVANNSSVDDGVIMMSVWNPFTQRLSSLKSLNLMGISTDPDNHYRVTVTDPALLCKWFRKRFAAAAVEQQEEDAGGMTTTKKTKKQPLRKWEKSLLEHVQKEQEQGGDSQQLDADDASIVKHVTSFIEKSFDAVVSGETRKNKTTQEPNVLDYAELSPEQQHVLQLAARGCCLFLGGGAGTGKSALLMALHAHLVKQLSLKVALCATTGVAGVHLGGYTFHSTVGVPSSRGGGAGQWDSATLRAIDVLICDEASMLSASLLECLDAAAKEARMSSAPFGGLQIVLCGDFLQLIDESAPQLLFESDVFKRSFVTVGLTQSQRHRCSTFREALAALRFGDLHPALEGCLSETAPHPLQVAGDTTYLFPKRAAADRVNELRLAHVVNEKKKSVDSSTEQHQGEKQQEEEQQEPEERVFAPQRGTIFLSGSFSSACVAHIVPGKMGRDCAAGFSAKKVTDTVHRRLGLRESVVSFMIARSGFAPQVVFRVKHPQSGKAEATEAAWKEAVAGALYEMTGGEGSGGCELHFEHGDLTDLVPVDVVASLGNAGAYSGGSGGGGSSNNGHASPSSFTSTSSSANTASFQPVRLRVGCRVLVNRNLSKTVVNGTLGEVVRFEEPDSSKFPFADNKALMHMWTARGGAHVAAAYGVLPVVQVKSRVAAAAPAVVAANDLEQQPEEADAATTTSTPTTTISEQQQQDVDEVTEYQIPPMFVSIGGESEHNWYQQSEFSLPLQLGYALTTHKAQGVTVHAPSRVIVDLRELTYKKAHLVYVACSRVRQLSQLTIVGFKKQQLFVEPRALAFTKALPTVEEVLEKGEEILADKSLATWTKKKKTNVVEAAAVVAAAAAEEPVVQDEPAVAAETVADAPAPAAAAVEEQQEVAAVAADSEMLQEEQELVENSQT